MKESLKLTDEQIEQRLTLVEKLIAKERNTTNLASLNVTYQRLIDEQVARDMERKEP